MNRIYSVIPVISFVQSKQSGLNRFKEQARSGSLSFYAIDRMSGSANVAVSDVSSLKPRDRVAS
jgi:hypothetical protein